jgi:galactokinase
MPAEPADRYAKPGSGNDPQYVALRQRFLDAFGEDDGDDNPHNDAPIHVCRSPGRVNLIGEHTDYSGGLVFPMAIEPRITFAFRRRGDMRVRCLSDRGEAIESFKIGAGRGEPAWTNYVRGPIDLLAAAGVTVIGMDVYLMSSLPVGAGLSSSAALEVGTAMAALHLGGGEMSWIEIAKLCQQAEHDYAGVPCGIMDQAIVAGASAGHAMLLDCRTLQETHVPLPADDVAVIVTDSKTEHALTGSEYADRADDVKAAAKQLGVPELRDATVDSVKASSLEDRLLRRARHVVSENERCQTFADALRAGDYEKAGEQMYASHSSLRDDYEVSTPELDHLVEAARGLDGVFGSRMTGAGFGGCTVTLCRPDHAAAVVEGLAKAAKTGFGVDTLPFVTSATDGAHIAD